MRHDRTESWCIDRIQPGRLGVCEIVGALVGGLALGTASLATSIGFGISAKNDAEAGRSKQEKAKRRAFVQRALARREETSQRVGQGLGRVAGGGLDASVAAGGTAAQVRTGEAIAQGRDIAQLRANFAAGITELNARASIAQNQATAGIVSGVFSGASTALNSFTTFKALQ